MVYLQQAAGGLGTSSSSTTTLKSEGLKSHMLGATAVCWCCKAADQLFCSP